MPDSIAIEKKQPGDPCQNYDQLWSEALQYVQQLSGKNWTDFNIHDPGVTILEQLCYAITELEYRASFDVADFLVSEASGQIDYARQGLFLPHDIFPSRPVTENDFRKVLFDAIPNVYNAWIYPQHDAAIKGLYKVVVGVDLKNDTQNRPVHWYKEQVKQVFARNRNLCEDLLSVEVVDLQEVKVHAVIEIDESVEPTDMMANLLLKISLFMLDEIPYHSLEEMLAKGLSLEEIFTGPLLSNGFIADDDLHPKRSAVSVEELLGSISSLRGIVSINKVKLETKDGKLRNYIKFRDEKVGLQLYLPRENEPFSIQLFREGRLQRVNFREVYNKLYKLKSVRKRVYQPGSDNVGLINRPQGTFRDFSRYYSIQNQFPNVYGINKYGVAGSSMQGAGAHTIQQRETEAKQLKAYLLIFEQVLANYLAQLASLKDLYSVDASVQRSYFSQVLQSVPNTSGLYHGAEGTTALGLAIGGLLAKQDHFADRRNRVLDYMLALYGETYDQKRMAQFNYYLNEEEFEHENIQSKIGLLAAIPNITANKSRAFNYLDEAWNTDNVSGAEARTSILLRLKNNGDRSCISVFGRYGLQLVAGNGACVHADCVYGEGQHVSVAEQELVEAEFSSVPFGEYRLINGNELDHLKQFIKPLSRGCITESFLQSGVECRYYRVGTLPNSDRFQLLHKQSDTGAWYVLGAFGDRTSAIYMANTLRNFLVTLNRDCEGMHLIEHVLLSESMVQESNSVNILDLNGSVVFTCNDAQTVPFDDVLTDLSSYRLRDVGNGNFQILLSDGDREIGTGAIMYSSEFDAQEAIAALVLDYLELVNEGTLQTRLSVVETATIDPEFFSFGLSILLPQWTARFNCRHFRTLAQNILFDCLPAHLHPQIYWCSYKEIAAFEEYYKTWTRLATGSSAKKQQAILLVNFLNKLRETHRADA